MQQKSRPYSRTYISLYYGDCQF